MKFSVVVPALATILLLYSGVLSSAAAKPTAALTGPLGLNIAPSARMDPAGIMSFTAGILEPYAYGALGFQIAEPLYIGLRQTAQTTDPPMGDADRLLPGVDIKLRLREETQYGPAIALGLQSAWGHKRTAGEYIALSKRWNDFDFTGGIGWGRMDGSGHIANPLSIFGDHFDKRRDTDGEMPNDIHDWFTGENAGLFAGIEYSPPFLPDSVSLKADWGADSYDAEKRAFAFDAPAPWSLGIAVRPKPWINMGAAIIGGDRVMGTFSLRPALNDWTHAFRRQKETPPLTPHRSGVFDGESATQDAMNEDTILRNARASADGKTADVMVEVDDTMNAPQFIGSAARAVARNGGEDVKQIKILPVRSGLRGPSVRLMREDLENALVKERGSPQEIWRNVEIDPALDEDVYGKSWFWPLREWLPRGIFSSLRLVADNETSLSEEDAGLTQRTAILIEERRMIGGHKIGGIGLRLNLLQNIDDIVPFRTGTPLPGRSDAAFFAQRGFALDRSYVSYLSTLGSGLHAAVTAGYIEEMYAGTGGEIIYRPHGKTWAVGADAWGVIKRDPFTFMNAGLQLWQPQATGHINAWYEIPDTDLTLSARAGVYLAGDVGGTIGIDRHFSSGARLKGFVTATNAADTDPFGGTTHLYSGIQLTLPLGNVKFIPEGSSIRSRIAPVARETGQTLDNPVPLYDMTEPFSLRHIARNWNGIIQ